MDCFLPSSWLKRSMWQTKAATFIKATNRKKDHRLHPTKPLKHQPHLLRIQLRLQIYMPLGLHLLSTRITRNMAPSKTRKGAATAPLIESSSSEIETEPSQDASQSHSQSQTQELDTAHLTKIAQKHKEQVGLIC